MRQVKGLWRVLVLLGGVWGALLLPPPVAAVPLTQLYEAEVPAADQGAEARATALGEALAEVLVRISGDRAMQRQPGVNALLASPGRYVQQYRYQPAGDAAVDEAPWRLWVRFDGAGLERALRDLGLPYWGRERPETLVWLAVEEGGRRQLLGEPDESPVKAWLQAAAQRRGLPLVFPLLDMEDRSQVRFSDIWGGFLEPLQRASERYRPQALLIGRLYQTATGAWQAHWILQVQGNEQRWSGSDRQLAGLAAEGVERAADALAARFAVYDTGGAGDHVRVTIAGVQRLEDYARLNRYFASLSAVQSAQLLALSGDRAEYQLQLQGDLAGLERALSIGSLLVPDPAAGPLQYRLQP